MRVVLMILCIFSLSFIVPGSFADQHLLLDQIKDKYKTEVGSECDTFSIYKNDDHTRERVKFLNKDLPPICLADPALLHTGRVTQLIKKMKISKLKLSALSSKPETI